MTPLVSIVIPAYKAQKWIAAAICSAVAQTWQRKEIIVVDDGSTDQTLAIARRFESHGVSVVTQDNKGAAAARNKAFSLSQGDYIQWLDADDLLAPDKIARQMETLKHCRGKRTLLSSTWERFLYRYQRAKFVPTALWCDLSPFNCFLLSIQQTLDLHPFTYLLTLYFSQLPRPRD